MSGDFTVVVILIRVCLQQQCSDFPSGYVSAADLEKEEGAGCCGVSRNGERVVWGRDKMVGRKLSFTQTL